MRPDGGNGAASSFAFDPRFMVFEFVFGLLLRSRQVEMVQSFKTRAEAGQSSCQQMIMGAGKTTVIGPLLALCLADGERLVTQVMPTSLLEFTRGIMRSAEEDVVLPNDYGQPSSRSRARMHTADARREPAAATDDALPTIVIEVEVDMHRRSLAFGVPGGPLVRAPNAQLTGCVRPWAYLWNSSDSVSLEARSVTRDQAQMVSHSSLREVVNVRETRHYAARSSPPLPLRSRPPPSLSHRQSSGSSLVASMTEATSLSDRGPLRSGRSTARSARRTRYNDVRSRTYLPTYYEEMDGEEGDARP